MWHLFRTGREYPHTLIIHTKHDNNNNNNRYKWWTCQGHRIVEA